MYVIAARTDKDLPDASAEFAFRVYSEFTGKKLWSNNHTLICKTLEKEGNADIVRKFFQKYPQYVENYSRIPNEKEAVQYLKENLKAKPSDMGYGFITYVLKGVNVPYDLVDSEYL